MPFLVALVVFLLALVLDVELVWAAVAAAVAFVATIAAERL